MSDSDLELHNPHDLLVKDAFQHRQVIQHLLQSRLPHDTLARIDMDSLRLTNKSFQTLKGKERHCDIVYSATVKGQSGYIYISLEHQSKEEEHMPLRQLEYNILLMRQHLKEGHKTLPLIVNICIYNGPKPYQGPATLLELFEHPDLAKEYLVSAYHLIDLRSDSIQKIERDNSAALAELMLKEAIRRNFCAWLDANEDKLTELAGPYNEMIFLYMLTLDPDKKGILERIEEIKDPTQKQIAMTAAQHLRQEGRQEGIQQGMRQGIQEGRQEGIQQGIQEGMHTNSLNIAKNMLSNMHLDMKTVSQATGLSMQELIRLQEESKH